jgi:dolichol-phosphate mannosyltransferase
MSANPQSAIRNPQSRVLVALATYNELDNLPSLVAAIRNRLPGADLLVVDDNSPDGTGQWCDKQAREAPWFTVIHREGKLGLGSATWAAMHAAIDRGYDFLITLDADWAHPPESLPELIRAAADADVVIGSRYCPGGAVAGPSWRRRAISRTLNRVTRVVLGWPVRDASTAYRVYRVELLRKVDFTRLAAAGYSYLEEILWRLHRLGARIDEVPITFTTRRAGVSKNSLHEAAGKLGTLVRLAWERLRKPRHRDDAG